MLLVEQILMVVANGVWHVAREGALGRGHAHRGAAEHHRTCPELADGDARQGALCGHEMTAHPQSGHCRHAGSRNLLREMLELHITMTARAHAVSRRAF